jgi:transitional endoplasmic reticulum ATPase
VNHRHVLASEWPISVCETDANGTAGTGGNARGKAAAPRAWPDRPSQAPVRGGSVSLRLTVGDGDDAGLGIGVALLSPGMAGEIGVAADELVTLRGGDETAAIVRTDDGLGEQVLLGSDTRTNAGVSVGESVTVVPASGETATAITVTPASEFRVRVGPDTIRSLLDGVPVTPGDRVRASLVGGSITVPLRVTSVEPSAPALVGETTEVTVASADTDEGSAVVTPDTTFDDVGGLAETIEQLRRAVVAPLRHPELADRFGDRTTAGVLLSGPTGTGKTMLVEAVANAADAALLRVTDPTGDSADLEQVVQTAAKRAPAVVCFDDLDTVAPTRDGGTHSEARATRRVATAIEQLLATDGVVVVGATNRVDEVDDSLRRGGRLEREIEVGVPDRDDRLEILRIHTAGLPLAESVDLPSLADRTHGFVGADLSTLVTEAVQEAIGRLPPEYVRGDDPIPETVLAEATVDGRDFEAALSRVEPSGMRSVAVERPSVGYQDIGGLDAVKTAIVRAVEWPLLYPDLFERFGSAPPSGILLYGPPGTGKTMLARAVASSTDANFIAVNGPELLNRYVGESERGIRNVFERARQHAPTIVFFDELDAIAKERRDGGGDTGVIERVVSQLLTELDGMTPREGVFVVAATNRPDMVDPALLRPGRLEKTLEVPLPDRDARREIFAVHTRSVPLADVDLAALAAATDGYNGSDIEAVVREAAMLAMDDYLRETGFEPDEQSLSSVRVGMDHFEQAIASVDPSVTPDMREYYADMAEHL